jgi:dihydropteroate synthase
MHVERVASDLPIDEYLKDLGVDGGGLKILAAKTRHYLFYIHDLHVGGANILKQDALSVGADLAVPKGTVIAQSERVDALLMATRRQLEELSRKELAQPFGLKALAQELKTHLQGHKPGTPQIMGVINANDDSFYSQSRFKGGNAIEAVETMIREGADIIDIGAVSSRPGSAPVTAAEELERITPIIDALYAQKLYERVRLSVDTYAPEVASYALEKGFHIINDITGFANEALAKLCSDYHATAVMMHMQGTPQTMQTAPQYTDLTEEITEFFEARLEMLYRHDVRDIVLDVGIGFGKTLQHNLHLIAHLEHFLKLGHPLLVGASRKSMIDKIITSPVEERLPGTLAIHLKAIEKGAEIIRVHDVKAHRQALAVAQAIASV